MIQASAFWWAAERAVGRTVEILMVAVMVPCYVLWRCVTAVSDTIQFGRGALVLAGLLVATSAQAQVVELAFDRTPLAPLLGSGGALIPTELDGNPATREWLQHRTNPQGRLEVHGVQFADGVVTVGAWFDPFTVVVPVPGDSLALAYMSTTGADGICRYIVMGTRGYYEIRVSYRP